MKFLSKLKDYLKVHPIVTILAGILCVTVFTIYWLLILFWNTPAANS